MKDKILDTILSIVLDFSGTVDLDERQVAFLEGEVADWDTVVKIGHAVAKVEGVHNVVNKLKAQGVDIPQKDYEPIVARGRAQGVVDEAQVIIVGAGVSGCGIARELAKYDLDILVLEMNEDVATGATKANNGNIHPGHAVKPGTLKAKLNVEGNRMYTQWAEDLGFELQRCGSMGVICEEELLPALKQALAVAQINGVDGAEIIDGAGVLAIEPNVADYVDPVAGLWLPSMGLVEPYEVTVALAENAAENGVRFRFNTSVGDVLVEDGKVAGVVTNQGIIKGQYVINCAGVYADEISAMAGDESYTIHPRKGTIAILDKNKKPDFEPMIEIVTLARLNREKNEESKGGGTCRTPEYNILLGPSATEVPDKEDNATSAADLKYAMSLNQQHDSGYGDIIRIFAGVRPADYKEDFVIEMSPVTSGFVNVGAIQSPGLAAAPAIAKLVEEILLSEAESRGTPLAKKASYQPRRERPTVFHKLSRAEQAAMIEKNPAYGRIVCRCETITEGEILDVIHSPVPPASIDGIKRRTRAGMGRCQGGFCQPRVLELLARETGQQWTEIELEYNGSRILFEKTREPGQHPFLGEEAGK